MEEIEVFQPLFLTPHSWKQERGPLLRHGLGFQEVLHLLLSILKPGNQTVARSLDLLE